MGKARRRVMNILRKEQADIQSAGKKRGLWANIGMGLGGLLAVGLTGGAAAPLMAGLMAAGGTYVGGKLGDIAARQSKLGGSGRIKGGRFFKGERESLIDTLQDKITTGALKSGLMAGFQQFKALGGLKEGGLGKIFKKGPGAQTSGFGKAFDLRGSALGKTELGQKLVQSSYPTVEKAKLSQLSQEMISDPMGTMKEIERVKNLPVGEGAMPIQDQGLIGPTELGPAFERRTRKTTGVFSDLDDWDGGVRARDVYAGAPQYDEFGSFTGGRHLDPSEALKLRQQEALEQFLSSPENRQKYGEALYQEGSVLGDDMTRDIMADYVDKDFEMPVHTSEKENIFDRWGGDISAKSDLKLAKRGFNLERPNVPVATEDTFLTSGEQLLEDAYKTLDIDQPGYSDMNVNRAFQKLRDYNAGNVIEDPGFSTFDEASWEEGSKKLSNIDFGLADEQIPWQKRFFPSDKSGKPGGFDPRY